ncbi:hypothetical protein [uncultured Eubacterium sp.]|uniref:hypothetical protein n=1 Tax=uncultured Eubacterium sp. TaxID=165185 RepID=UPI002673309D|nr:hypothetical protein [uncultured Eubacterium sp.]
MKKVIIVIVILIILGAAITIGVMYNQKQSEKKEKEINVSQVTDSIPDVNIYYDGEIIGTIDGYTMEMNHGHMRDNIVPVLPDNTVPMEIRVNKNKVKSLSYEVTYAENDKLIDNGSIDGLEEKDGKIFFDYHASAIMEQGQEYLLKFTMQTDKHEKIYYYTRVMSIGEDIIGKQIDFAKDFSDKTFDEEKSSELAAYLEPNSEYASDSLGETTIRSNYGMLIWKTLHPEKITKSKVYIKDFCIKDSGEAGTYTMNYQIKAKNAQKIEETYNVSETITVWTFSGKQYVLAYNREVNQIWEANKNNVGNSFIDLGIQKQSAIKHIESEKQNFISYAINGDVYTMDTVNKKFAQVYHAKAANSEQLYKIRSKVLKVNDDGNTEYMIYGYSPSKNHVGKNGISIMEYSWKENKSIEKAFIPCDEPAQILETQMSQLCYEGDGTLYIMLGRTVYFANLRTKEWGTLIENMEDGCLTVNEQGTVIAYNTNGSRLNSDSITIVNLVNGNKNEILADKGDKITVCGYTGANLVYGTGKISPNKNYTSFPIGELKIVDENLKEVKSYSQRGITMTDVEITDTIISFKRFRKGKRIDDDQLLDNTEDKVQVANSSYYSDDMKMRELALSFTNKLDANIELSIGKWGELQFRSNSEVKSEFVTKKEGKFYVYGYGKLQGIYTSRKKAEEAAREAYGLVTDEKGSKIWVFEEHYSS